MKYKLTLMEESVSTNECMHYTCINAVDSHILYPHCVSERHCFYEYAYILLKIQHNALRIIFLVDTVCFLNLFSFYNGDLNPNIAGTYIYRLDWHNDKQFKAIGRIIYLNYTSFMKRSDTLSHKLKLA